MRCFPVIFGLISFLPVAVQGKYNLTGSEVPIKAQVGSDVVLPCSVEPPVNVTDAIVKWMFNFNKIVHLFHNKADDRKAQDERYKDRTILNHKMIEHGNVSLKLTKVTKNDAGNYTCSVPRLPDHDKSEKRNVTLVVVDGNESEDPNRRYGDKNGDQDNLNATKGPDPGVNGCVVAGVIGGVVVVASLILISIIILIIYCVVRRCRGEPIFPCGSNNSRNEEVRNDGGMEMEELHDNRRGNGNQGDEAEPLQNQEEPN